MKIFAALLWCGVFASPSVAQRPNILIMMTDDIGIEGFGAYGGTEYSTPNIDALAAGGAKFNHAYSTPLCTPSRVQLMTGQHSFRNYEWFGWLDPAEATFTESLGDTGYRTAVAGKWQLSAPERPEIAPPFPTLPNITPQNMSDHHGVDDYSLWFLNSTNQQGSRYWDPVIEQNGVVPETTMDDYGPAMHVDFLNDFMADSVASDTPFVAYYPMALPHSPWVGVPDPDNPTQTLGGASKTASSASNFADNVEYLDRQVGQLVGQLDALGVREETLIIFTSDNGTDTAITSDTTDGTVTGEKGTQTEYGTHVPLILNWQGTIAAEETDNMADFTDVFPTLLEVAGVDAPEGVTLDGQTLISADGTLTEDQGFAYNWYDAKGRDFPSGEWARDQKYKLYRDGRFFDISQTPLEGGNDSIDPGTGSPEAEAARVELQAVLDGYLLEQTDITGDDVLDTSDLDAFLDGYQTDTLALPNIDKIAAGDLTIDGITDLVDWNLMRDAYQALNGVALPADPLELAGILAADITGDGVLDGADVNAFVQGWRADTSLLSEEDKLAAGDLNLDGVTDFADWFLFRAAFLIDGVTLVADPTSFVPEPSAGVMLVSVGCVSALRRR